MKRILAVAVILLALVTMAQGFRQTAANRRRNGLRQNPPAAQMPAETSAAGSGAGEAGKVVGASDLNYNQAPLDLVLEAYSRMKGKTILKDPQVPNATITLMGAKGQKLTEEEQLEAIETVLEMNGVHLEAYQDSFIRALPRKDARKEGIPLIMDAEAQLRESGRVVSMMIPFKNIATEEAQKALEGFKSASGILLVFERTNSILVTDTEQNINRMLEIAKAIDISTPVGEVVEYIQIKYANANDVKSVIDSIVQESQKEQEKNGKEPARAQPAQSPFGRSPLLNRNRQQQQQQQAPVNNESLVLSVSDADRGMIRGKVVTIADERSNKILIITSASNMKFFKDVIAALDVETTPDTVVKVYRLKYADSEDVSDMINDLIGNSVSGKSSGKANQNQNAKQGTSGSVTRGNTQTSRQPANQRSGEAKAGELNKDNTTVLADKRINGIVVMTQKELVPTIEQIIEAMDVKLDQVLIETVIIEVGLNNEFKTGIDWVKGLQTSADGERFQQALGGGSNPSAAISGSGSDSNAVGRILIDGAMTALPTIFAPGSGLTYALFSEKFNLGAVINASKSDNNSKYLASPVVMTVDNKEATINATRMKYLLKGFTSSGNSYSTIAVPDYEQKELGIEIKITPKINPSGTVMLTVEEKYTQVGDNQTIQYSAGTGGEGGLKDVSVPTTITREMSADVILENSQTVVFGGLTETTEGESESGIPFLKDIPVIGKYLFGSTGKTEDRRELLVFMTPYVIKDGSEAEAEALRRKQSLSDQRPWQDHGWSKSKLADPITAREQLRRQKEEWKKLDEEHKTGLDLEKAKRDRVRELKRRAREESEKRREEAKEEAEKDQEDAEAEAEEAKKVAEEEAERTRKEVESKAQEIERLNKEEEKKAEQRAEAEAAARKTDVLLQQLHAENGIPEVK